MDSSHHTQHIADAPPNNWVERFLPSAMVPFAQLMRLDRPIGWWLLLLPCWWSLCLAQVSHGSDTFNFWHGFLFLIGAIVMRGAGCVLNDLADRDFDAQVERTKSRPLPSGRVTVKATLIFLVVLCGLGLLVLLQFNLLTIVTGVASLAIVAVYPFMKRITHYPQLVLGLAFNWGALLGWTATTGAFAWPALLLYFAGIAWTLGYDTIYAHQDKEDDILIGVKSTALKFGDQTQGWLIAFYGVAVILFGCALALTPASWPSYLALILATLQATWQIRQFNGNNSDVCLKLFKSNRTFGLIIFTGLFLDCFI